MVDHPLYATSELFFDHPWLANIVALSFVILLYLAGPSSPISALREIYGTMERNEEGKKLWGPFYYAISILILTLIFTLSSFTLYYWIAAASLTIMYLGDGLASIIGKKYAKRTFTVIKGSKRSIIGSLTFFTAGFGGAIFAIWFNGIVAIEFSYGPGSVLVTWDMIIILSLIATGIGTLIEFFSPLGYDNLTVPFVICTFLSLIYLLFI
ncbi:MAG: diacylglycerol/polyprenol kinase family protein [Promethearchaeota archaeon]